MLVAPKIDWNSCGKISAISSKTACCMLKRTNRGVLPRGAAGQRDPRQRHDG